MEEINCNLCGATASSPLYTLQDPAFDVPGEFVLRRCLQCGLMYLSPRPTPETLNAHYPADYAPYRPAIEDERLALMRWMRRRKLAKRRRMVERYSGRNPGRLLDVGCATGLFLHEMAEAGWQVAGIEPASSAAEYARRRFGLSVFTGTLTEAPYEPATFDAITFWDVLEHTFSPAEELAHAARLLRSGGALIASVPNWESLERRLWGCHWIGLDPPRHLYVFSRDTLTALLTNAGFDVLDWVCFLPGYFPFVVSLERSPSASAPWLARPIRWVLDLPGMRLPFQPWFTALNWLGRGPVITVFARRLTPEKRERKKRETTTTRPT